MPAIGITGGISTGKSTFCDCLRAIIPSAKFFNADLAVRALTEVPQVKQEILDRFGSEIFSPETASEMIGNSVPHSTAKQLASRIRLLNMKLDSRETTLSSCASLFK